MSKPKPRIFKPKRLNETARAYNVSVRTFESWLKPHAEKLGDYRGKMFTPKQMEFIYDTFGPWEQD